MINLGLILKISSAYMESWQDKLPLIHITVKVTGLEPANQMAFVLTKFIHKRVSGRQIGAGMGIEKKDQSTMLILTPNIIVKSTTGR